MRRQYFAHDADFARMIRVARDINALHLCHHERF